MLGYPRRRVGHEKALMAGTSLIARFCEILTGGTEVLFQSRPHDGASRIDKVAQPMAGLAQLASALVC
jgi:hypothetical protein